MSRIQSVFAALILIATPLSPLREAKASDDGGLHPVKVDTPRSAMKTFMEAMED